MQWLNKIKSALEKRRPRQEYFLALIIKENEIKATVWEEKEGQATVLDSTTTSSKTHIDELADEELLALADEAIGLAEKNLPTDIKTTKTIFGLRETWIEGSAIKEPYVSKIKKLSKELELIPLGFVVIPEAISHLLKIEEGTPPTVLLVWLGKEFLGVTLVRSGRIEKSKTSPKEGKSNSETVTEILKSFGDVEILPSRILLFDGEVLLEEAKQEFISYPWTKELSFLHFPKIDILPADFDARAVVSGGASEMGFTFEEASQSKSVADQAETKEEEEKEEDILAKPADGKSQEETLGFVKERDVLEEAIISEERLEENEEEPITPIQQPRTPLLPKAILSFGLSSLSAPLASLQKLIQGWHMRLWLPLLAVMVLLLVLAGAFILLPTATIDLLAEKRTLENDIEVAIDTNATSVDKEGRKIPASIVETKVSGEKTEQATGKKTVGDKATGEVTIYNKTENKKTFPKGTALLGPNDLRFTLDEDVSVASTAAFELTPSSTKAKVTASQIGEESNVVANTNFPFKDFPTSSYFAKNDAPFTGGTKREVVAVSEEDQEALLAALSDELTSKAKEELSQKSQGSQIVDIDIKEEIVSKKFNRSVGDEADSLSLSLTISFSTLAYKEEDLLEIVGSEIERSVPEGFSFQKDIFETAAKRARKEKTGTTLITMHYKATLIPNIDTAEIRNTIVGKRKSAVERYLESLPIERFTISQNIELPPPFDLLPQRAESITIKLKSKE